MDTVILAAGRNERLRAVVPPYLKPLVLVNGRPLIQTLVQQAFVHTTHKQGEHVIVVASPENIKPIISVVDPVSREYGSRVRYVIQPDACGPLFALSYGLDLVNSRDFVMACGDNICSDRSWLRIGPKAEDEFTLVVPTQTRPVVQSLRFTVMRKEPGGSHNYKFFNGISPGDPFEGTSSVECWIGPIRLKSELARKHLQMMFATVPGNGLHFADLFNRILRECPQGPGLIESDAIDIGIPEELPS